MTTAGKYIKIELNKEGSMTNEAKAPVADKVDTIESLQAELKAAVNAKEVNWKLVGNISEKLDKMSKAKASAEREATLKALEGTTAKVKAAIEKAIEHFLDDGTLEKADGIWYSNDFGEALTQCRLMKSAGKKAASGGGGGAGKSFGISTDQLLLNHGGKMMGDSGMTYKEAYDADTDGNKRYTIRKRLLKEEGLV